MALAATFKPFTTAPPATSSPFTGRTLTPSFVPPPPSKTGGATLAAFFASKPPAPAWTGTPPSPPPGAPPVTPFNPPPGAPPVTQPSFFTRIAAPVLNAGTGGLAVQGAPTLNVPDATPPSGTIPAMLHKLAQFGAPTAASKLSPAFRGPAVLAPLGNAFPPPVGTSPAPFTETQPSFPPQSQLGPSPTGAAALVSAASGNYSDPGFTAGGGGGGFGPGDGAYLDAAADQGAPAPDDTIFGLPKPVVYVGGAALAFFALRGFFK